MIQCLLFLLQFGCVDLMLCVSDGITNKRDSLTVVMSEWKSGFVPWFIEALARSFNPYIRCGCGLSVLFVQLSFVCLAWQVLCDKFCIAKSLTLHLTCKLSYQILSYQPCLQGPLTASVLCHVHWP